MRPKPAPPTDPLLVRYEMLSENGLLAFRVTTPKPGYLYILNYGQDGPKWTFNLLEPRNSGPAKRTGGETLRIPEKSGFAPNTPDEKNIPYLVWAAEPVSEIEGLKSLPQKHGVAVVDNPAQIAVLHKFLGAHTSEVTQNGGQTEVRTTEKVLVHEISLDRK